MQKSLLVLLALAIAIAAGWLLADPGRGVPLADGTDATDPGLPAAATPATDEPTADAGRTEQPAQIPPQVTAVPTTVEVLVQLPDGTPVTGRAVSLVDTDPETPYLAHLPTDERGVATFTVPVTGTRRMAAFVSGGLETWFDLPAGETSRQTLDLPVRLQVEGRVVDASGVGIAGAELVYLPWLVRQVAGLPRVTVVGTTLADGSFSVSLPSGGHLGAWHARFAPSTMALVEAPNTAPQPGRVTIELTLLAAPGHVTGIVLAEDARPVAGAAVELRSLEEDPFDVDLAAPPIRLLTASDGRFATQRLRPGRVRFEALGPDGGCARGVVTVTEHPAGRLEIRLLPAATVHGAVRDADGNACCEVIVQSGRPGDLLSCSAECGSGGRYVLAGLPPGPAQLTARERGDRPGGAAAARRVTTTLDLPPGQQVEWSPLLEAAAGPRLAGLVVDERNRALPRWTVLALVGNEPPQRGATDRDGRFALPACSGARYDILVYPPGRPLTMFAAAVVRAVDPQAGERVIVVDRSAPRSAVLGRVEAADLKPVPAKVTCRHAELGQTVPTTADANGSFRFDDVPFGAITLIATHPGYLEAHHDGAVTPGARLDVGALMLTPGSAVHGDVRTTGAALPEQLEISIQAGDRRFSTTSVGGAYRFDAVPPGRHRLLVQGTGIAAASFTIQVPPDAEFEQDIVVDRGVERTIQVASPASRGRWIALVLQRADQPYTWWAEQPCGGDVVEFTAWMAPGTYEALAWDDAGQEGSGMVRFSGEAMPPSVLHLAPRER